MTFRKNLAIFKCTILEAFSDNIIHGMSVEVICLILTFDLQLRSHVHTRARWKVFGLAYMQLETSGRWVGTRAWAVVTATLMWSFFGPSSWLHEHRRQHTRIYIQIIMKSCHISKNGTYKNTPINSIFSQLFYLVLTFSYICAVLWIMPYYTMLC